MAFWIETKSIGDLSASPFPVNPGEDVLLHRMDERRKNAAGSGRESGISEIWVSVGWSREGVQLPENLSSNSY